MRTGFMYFGQLFKVFINFTNTAMIRDNSLPRFRSNLPRGIFSIWGVPGRREFSFGEFLSKNSINDCCLDQWFMPGRSNSVRDQSADHIWTGLLRLSYTVPGPSGDPATVFDNDKVIFSFQLWANDDIYWLCTIFINHLGQHLCNITEATSWSQGQGFRSEVQEDCLIFKVTVR